MNFLYWQGTSGYVSISVRAASQAAGVNAFATIYNGDSVFDALQVHNFMPDTGWHPLGTSISNFRAGADNVFRFNTRVRVDSQTVQFSGHQVSEVEL